MWWNGRFASWMCSWQICSNCVILSSQYGPKSLRNVSNTLLNLCHEKLRQFWRQKGVKPGTSKVYLIRWPVSVCMCTVFIYYVYIYIHTIHVNIYIHLYIYVIIFYIIYLICKYNIFFWNIYMCLYLYIHNKYTQYTVLYYVNKNIYFGCD